jgi:hypothetical protein
MDKINSPELNNHQIQSLMSSYEELFTIQKFFLNKNLNEYPFEDLNYLLESMSNHFPFLKKFHMELSEQE